MSTKFRLNHSGMATLLMETNSILAPYAAGILARMQASCPIGDTGDLLASLEVWDDPYGRARKRVGSRGLRYAIVVEADTGFMARSL